MFLCSKILYYHYCIYVPVQYDYVLSKLYLSKYAVNLCPNLFIFMPLCSIFMCSPNYICDPIQYNNVLS